MWLLPVNQYVLRELPLKRLQQQREDNGGPHQLVECKSCGEQAGPVVAWCEDGNGVIRLSTVLGPALSLNPLMQFFYVKAVHNMSYM